MAKTLTLWDLKRQTPKKTPNKKSVHLGCSPKRFKINDILEESREKTNRVNSARNILSSVEASDRHLSREDNLLLLVNKLGFSTVKSLMQCIKHVPSNFPRKQLYIHDIMNNAVSYQDIKLAEFCAKFSSAPKGQHNVLTDTDFIELLWKQSFYKQTPYMCFLSPPVESCVQCGCYLVERSVCKVTLYTMFGPLPGLKCSLRCTSCGITYEIDRYHYASCDSKFYNHCDQQETICASGRVYFSRDVFELLCELGNHAFVSAQAFAETYNSVFHNDHPNMRQFIAWQSHMAETTKIGEHADTEEIGSCDTKFVDESAMIDDNQKEVFDAESAVTDSEVEKSGCQVLMTRKNTMNVFLNGELIKELHERNMLHNTLVGNSSTREDAMKTIDILRRKELYPHRPEDCSSVCRGRGCENLRVIDGCWKLCIPHCMMSVNVEVKGHPLLNFPNVCTAETAPNSVFCHEHLQLLIKHKIPTDKKAFLQHIGCKGNPKSKSDIIAVDEKILEVSGMLQMEDQGPVFSSRSAIAYQGIDHIVKDSDPALFELDTTEKCNKDTGEKSRLRQRSRGVFVCASGGGNILCFNPIYKSESPSQVFMLTVNMIYQELKDVPEDELDDRIENYILSYDNMCHLDQLKASKEELPLPEPFRNIWQRIKKVIDRLHLNNHKNKICQSKYNPDKILPPGYNTMATEQVFAWMSRYKKVVNSMTQTHHLFYLHRMCKRRNIYTGQCRRRGREPVLPGINYKNKMSVQH